MSYRTVALTAMLSLAARRIECEEKGAVFLEHTCGKAIRCILRRRYSACWSALSNSKAGNEKRNTRRHHIQKANGL